MPKSKLQKLQESAYEKYKDAITEQATVQMNIDAMKRQISQHQHKLSQLTGEIKGYEETFSFDRLETIKKMNEEFTKEEEKTKE